MSRILVTGSRDFTAWRLVEAAMVEAIASLPDWPRVTPTIVHGAARGADRIANGIAINRNWKIESHPADWEQYGKAAGMIRNREMLESGVDLCLAFLKTGAKNIGTRGMIRLCKRARVPVLEYWEA